MSEPAIVVIDFETTGLSANGGDRVVEVGLVRLNRDLRVEREYGTLVNPECPVGATRIHGITDADVVDAPTFRDIAGDVGEFLEGAVIAGHNTAFDLRFLWSEFAHVGLTERLPADLSLSVIDTLDLSRRYISGVENFRLASVCAACGVPAWANHGALGDAKATAQLLARIVEMSGDLLRHEVFGDGRLLAPGWTGRTPSGRSKPRLTLATLAKPSSKRAVATAKPLPLAGEFAVITGGTGISREEAIRVAEMLGCSVRNSVSGKTTIAVIGDPGEGRWTRDSMDMTGKHREALDRAAAGQPIRILAVAEFLRLAEVCSDGVITDEEWTLVRELVYGANPPAERLKTRKRRPRALEADGTAVSEHPVDPPPLRQSQRERVAPQPPCARCGGTEGPGEAVHFQHYCTACLALVRPDPAHPDGRPCGFESCTNRLSPHTSARRKYCAACNLISAAPNRPLPGDVPPMKLYFQVESDPVHQDALRCLAADEALYLVRDSSKRPTEARAIEVRTGAGVLLGFVPGPGRKVEGRYGYGNASPEGLAAALDLGSSYTARASALATDARGVVTLRLSGHCNGWMHPHPVRIEKAKKTGRPVNIPADALPFLVSR